jgi:hypothetical protein
MRVRAHGTVEKTVYIPLPRPFQNQERRGVKLVTLQSNVPKQQA